MPLSRASLLGVVACASLLVSCDSEPKSTIPEYCDPIVPEFCAYPFPSNLWLVPDPSMPSGKRVEIDPRTLPVSDDGTITQGTPFRFSDGFSPGNEFITYLPGMTIEGLADADHIEDSVLDSSPTIILDEATGERIPHWAELDMQAEVPDQRALLIRPAVRLDDEHTYIVAVRNVKDAAGAVIPASPAFAAFRDRGRYPHPTFKPRRARYEQIFTALAAAGVERASLQIAWDMTTSSQENQSSRMLHVRDEGLETLGDAVPTFVIDEMIEAPQAGVARRLKGHVEVPLYLTTTGLGGQAILDEQGLPTQNGTAMFPFSVVITDAAVTSPTDTVLQYGHGIFGTQEDVMRGEIVALANSMNAVIVATDWLGMSTVDAASIGLVVISGELETFVTVPDRGQQGMLNAMYALRVVTRGLAAHASTMIGGDQILSPGARYFVGNSLGGIYGSTYVSISPDIERAVLFVPGQPFSMLLPRSEVFSRFDGLLDNFFGNDLRTHPYLLALVQMLWDRVEPTGFSNHIFDDPFPGSFGPDVMVIDAIGDPSVSTRGARIMARTMGLTSLSPANRPVLGVPVATGPVQGRAFLEVSFGLPPEAVTNTSFPQTPNPHDMPFQNAGIRAIAKAFLETGIATNTCEGTCDPN